MKAIRYILIFFFAISCSSTGAIHSVKKSLETTTGVLNITDYGAVGDNRQSSAETNYNAFRTCIDIIKSKGSKSLVYVPSGIFITRSLAGLDLRYVSFKGDTKRRSIIKLADNENKPIIDTRQYFDCFIEDIQFDGNSKQNPNSEALVKFSSGNVYDIELNRVHFRNYQHNGLFIDGGQHFVLNNVDTRFGGKFSTGIRIKDALNVTLFTPRSEQNGSAGIVIESSVNTKAKFRYSNPQIKVVNPYLEGNPTGIILNGVCRVSIDGGMANGNTFCKIKNSDEHSYSLFNTIKGRPIGTVIIEKGNYGNKVIGNDADGPALIDHDGRNGQAFLEWNYLSQNFNGSAMFVKMNTCAADYKFENSGDKRDTINYRPNGFLGKLGYSSNFKKPMYVEVVSNVSNRGSRVVYYPKQYWKANTTAYFYTLLELGISAELIVKVYDVENKVFYNWNDPKHYINDANNISTSLRIPSNGKLQPLKIPIHVDHIDRKLMVQLIIKSKEFVPSKSRCYYFLLSENDNIGMLHYNDKKLIGNGFLPIK